MSRAANVADGLTWQFVEPAGFEEKAPAGKILASAMMTIVINEMAEKR